MAKLALKGGNKVLPNGYGVTWPIYDNTDEEALLAVYRSGNWWRGGTIEAQANSACGRFEKNFAAFHGAGHALAVSNGTVALELVLRAAGIGPGDEVIVPAVSFVVTASMALTVGAWPIFVDIDPETYQIDASKIEAVITTRTKAVCLVHFGGYPADLDRITAICEKHNLILIEDAAHSVGSEWRGKGLGAWGNYGTFSFQQFKSLTSGEGGIVLARSFEEWKAIYRYHNLGRRETEGFYDFYELASNYRLTDLQGALLNSQFVKFPAQMKRRMAAADRLRTGLEQVPGVRPLPADSRITRRGYYYFLMHYDPREFRGLPRDKFLEAMAAEGVSGLGRAYGKPIHKYPLFQELKAPAEHKFSQYAKDSFPVAEHVMANELLSLHHPALLAEDAVIDKIVEAMLKIRENADELL